MKFKVNRKEKLYFIIMTVISLFVYLIFCFEIAKKYNFLRFLGEFLFISIPFILLIKKIIALLFIGHLNGNAIRITPKQFPEIFDILDKHSMELNLKKIPEMYVQQGNGILNAFAAREARKNIIIIYSDIFELAYNDGIDAVSFIIGHELAHIQRKHVNFTKFILTLPARIIPMLNLGYSRACEYTCDNFGYTLSPKGAKNGLLILTAGKKLYKKVDVSELINDAKKSPFALWLTEQFATHPHLVNRLDAINKLEPQAPKSNLEDYLEIKKENKSQSTINHEVFMPKN